jgi:hypothetical protein
MNFDALAIHEHVLTAMNAEALVVDGLSPAASAES